MQARENLLLHYETYVIPFQRGVKDVQFEVVVCRANMSNSTKFKKRIRETRKTLQVMRDSLEKAVRFVYRNSVAIYTVGLPTLAHGSNAPSGMPLH